MIGMMLYDVVWFDIVLNCEPHVILNISDIDECSEGNFTCHPNATCMNTQGSYNCQCKNGYVRNGKENCTGIRMRVITDILTYRPKINKDRKY
jgi:hypothetical protein